MHGIGISEDILKIIKKRAREEKLDRIRKVKVKIGEMYMVSKEEILQTFEMVSKGSVADGAQIEVDIIPLTVKCGECENVLKGKEFSLSCPGCGGTDLGILSGEDLIVEALEP